MNLATERMARQQPRRRYPDVNDWAITALFTLAIGATLFLGAYVTHLSKAALSSCGL